MSIGNGSFFAASSGGLTLSNQVSIVANDTASFTGVNSITIGTNTAVSGASTILSLNNASTYAVFGQSGNPWNINNMLGSAAALTINYSFVDQDVTTANRTLTINGTGNTVMNGALLDSSSKQMNVTVNTAGTVVLNPASPNGALQTGLASTNTSGSPTVTLSTGLTGLFPGMAVTGAGIPMGAYILSVGNNTPVPPIRRSRCRQIRRLTPPR